VTKLAGAALDFFRKTGRLGGKARVKNQTAQQRKDSARRAAQARWAKQKKQKSET
jgi:hypothetical protein